MYLIATVPQDITKSLDEIIQKKHEARANKDLAGNIQNEFFINDGKGIIWPMLDVLIKQYFEKYPEYLGRISGMQNKK